MGVTFRWLMECSSQSTRNFSLTFKYEIPLKIKKRRKQLTNWHFDFNFSLIGNKWDSIRIKLKRLGTSLVEQTIETDDFGWLSWWRWAVVWWLFGLENDVIGDWSKLMWFLVEVVVWYWGLLLWRVGSYWVCWILYDFLCNWKKVSLFIKNGI